jgi:hypothetical protein
MHHRHIYPQVLIDAWGPGVRGTVLMLEISKHTSAADFAAALPLSVACLGTAEIST